MGKSLLLVIRVKKTLMSMPCI